MAREICFCGWVGALEDRKPVYAGAGEWGLGCPMCGRLDRLEACRRRPAPGHWPRPHDDGRAR